MRQHRITDLTDLTGSEAVIDEHLAAGEQVILQYSAPIYTPELLAAADALCRRFGEDIQLRFYGHYSSPFDCRVLHQVPSVVSLYVDCLMSASHLEAIHDLKHLRVLSLGIDDLAVPDILAGENLRDLHTLILGGSRKPIVDLAHLAQMPRLRYLHVTGHSRNMDTIGDLPALETLSLSSAGKAVRLDFVNRIASLRLLRIILGGRSDIGEVVHPGVRSLEIIRVRGLEQFDPSAFPGLTDLLIEDQARLSSLAFTGASDRLERLRLINCKGLASLAGLRLLAGIRELRVSGTALDLDDLISQGLPPNMRIFAFYTGKESSSRAIQARLQQMGYSES